MSPVKLHYFNLRGRAEYIRWILEFCGVEYEDIRYTFEEWPQIKQRTVQRRGESAVRNSSFHSASGGGFCSGHTIKVPAVAAETKTTADATYQK